MEKGNRGERVRGDYSRHNPTLRDLLHAVISGVLFEGELKGRTRQGRRLGAAVISPLGYTETCEPGPGTGKNKSVHDARSYRDQGRKYEIVGRMDGIE